MFGLTIRSIMLQKRNNHCIHQLVSYYTAVYNVYISFHYCFFTDAARPSGVNACISYNATGFAHLNLQWEV